MAPLAPLRGQSYLTTALLQIHPQALYMPRLKISKSSFARHLYPHKNVDLAAKAFYTNRKRYFTHFAGQMADGTIDQKTADLLLSAFSHFKCEYLKTWNHLTIKERQVAVEHLVDPLVGQLIKAIATVVYGETEKIQAASTLRAFAPARLAVEWIVDHLADDQMDVVAKAVVDTLKKIDSGEFAKTFESHTRLYLELIRINGTGLGFLLGGLLGFVL